ncbi:hypothetical protein [Actinomadura luteofluorescens]|uniref:hypothetical protein n=1 Tax=Actinomadura luteofluorescens TaxID=46163 RepID=UPI003D90D3B4
MSIKPTLMWRRTGKPGVAEDVERRATEAAQLAKIPGQNRLTDPRTNPAVRPHADRLRDDQHRKALDYGHARTLRGLRVEDRRASHAEKALEAIQAAREASSPAKSVLFLHGRRNLYMQISLFTSVALAGGSAMGLEKLAENYKHIPQGSGIIAEVGLTGLATLVILARSDLAQHSTDSLKQTDWRNWALWVLMVLPLAASMAANVHGGNFLGAVCAAGAAAFSLFSYVVGVLFADAANGQAKKVTGDDEDALREIASGDALLAQPERVPQTFFEDQGLPFVPLAFAPRRVVVQSEQVPALAGGSDPIGPDQVQTHGSNGSETRSDPGAQTQVSDQVPNRVSDLNGNRSETHSPDRSGDLVPDPDGEKVPDQVPPDRSQTRKTQTGPKKQTRSKTKPKAKPLDRLNEAKAVDKAYLDDHGRHIPAEKLARALSIGKPAALDLVKQVRGGHIDIAK